MNEPFVDIHCHLLPGLDDGAATLDESLAMAELAVADGIGTVIATPHQLGNHSANSGAAICEAAARFQQTLDRRHIPLRVWPGADVRIEPDVVRKIRIGEVLSLADRRRHVLLELPHGVYLPLDGLLAELKSAGMVGILSHPERNRGILSQPGVLRPLIERGCLLQVTAGSLTGDFGPQIQRFCRWLVRQGLVHFVSTDAHGTTSRRPNLKAAFDQVTELVGRATAVELCCRNPATVAAGGDVGPPRQSSLKADWRGWLRRTFFSEPVANMPIL